MTMAAPDTIKGIQHIAVKKAKLIAVLKENLESHLAQYKEAYAGYRKALISTLGKMYDDAKKGVEVEHAIVLDIPENHAKDYKRVIGMLEMSVDDTVLITATEYNTYVLDDWGWKERFTRTSTEYKSR